MGVPVSCILHIMAVVYIGPFSLIHADTVVRHFPGASIGQPAIIRVGGDWNLSRAIALGAFGLHEMADIGSLSVKGTGADTRNLARYSYVSAIPRAEISLFWETVEPEIGLGRPTLGELENEIFSALGLSSLLRRNPLHLSGGETAKMILASHLIRQPDLLIVDRILGELDAATRQKFLSFVHHHSLPAVLVVIDDVILGKGVWHWDANHDPVTVQFDDPEESEGGKVSESSILKSPDFRLRTLGPCHTTGEKLVTVDLLVGRGGHPILPPLNLSVGKGSLVWVIGPNGSGKTTFFETLIGLLEPIAGVAMWSTEVGRQSLETRITYSPQEPDDDVTETTFMAEILASARPRHSAATARDWLQSCGVSASILSSPLSEDVAVRKLASIFAAIARDREVIVVDEPSLFLSSSQKRWVAEALMRSLTLNGSIVLCSTHDPDFFSLFNDALLATGASIIDHQRKGRES